MMAGADPMLSIVDSNATFKADLMTDKKPVADISISELRVLLEICQKLLAHSHPSAALMIDYAAKDLEKSVQTDSQRPGAAGARPKRRLNAKDGDRGSDQKRGGSSRRPATNH
jgi:hypothetical protein